MVKILATLNRNFEPISFRDPFIINFLRTNQWVTLIFVLQMRTGEFCVDEEF